MAKENRWGRFSINFHIIDEEPEIARAILSGVLVTRAEALFAQNCIEYIGTHPRFEPVEQGGQIPRYIYNQSISTIQDPLNPDDPEVLYIVNWHRKD